MFLWNTWEVTPVRIRWMLSEILKKSSLKTSHLFVHLRWNVILPFHVKERKYLVKNIYHSGSVIFLGIYGNYICLIISLVSSSKNNCIILSHIIILEKNLDFLLFIHHCYLLTVSNEKHSYTSYEQVHRWPKHGLTDGDLPLTIGQISGVAVDDARDLVFIFHRGKRVWGGE